MEITIFNKNLDANEEKVFSDYLGKKRRSFETLLKNYPVDGKIMKANVEKFEKHDAFEVELSLTLGANTYIAAEASHLITKAVDLAKDRLLAQLRKHKELNSKERKHKSIRENKEKMAEVHAEETIY